MSSIFDYLLPPAKSTLAHETDALFTFINVAGFLLLLAITIAIIYFVIKYRRKSEHDVTPVIHHNNTLEITWSVIPLVLVMIIFGWGFKVYTDISTPPNDAYEIHVTGKQWLWQFSYANGANSIGELHVPANRPVKLIMSSDDVIHSFYVPDYRVKKDVLPNRYTTVWFQAKKPGESQIFCTEYCGTGHSNMLAKVVVQKQDEFQAWLDQKASGGGSVDKSIPPAERGKKLVSNNACLTCHSTDGSEKTGPTWKGIWGRKVELSNGKTVTVDENYIRQSILEPKSQIVKGFQPVMPTYQGSLNDSQINSIIEYLKTLK